MRRTVPPSAEIQQKIDGLLASMTVSEAPAQTLSELAGLGARLIIQRAVEDECDAWLGRSRYERRPEYQRGLRNFDSGLRNGFRPRRVQTAEGELQVQIPQVREAAEPFVSRLFPRGYTRRLLRTEPLKAMVVGAFVRGLSMRDVELLCDEAGLGKLCKSSAARICAELRERFVAFVLPETSRHQHFHGLPDQLLSPISRDVLRLGVYNSYFPLRVVKDDGQRRGFYEGPKLFLSLLQLRQVPDHRIKAVYFSVLVSVGYVVNVKIPPPKLLVRYVTEACRSTAEGLLDEGLESTVYRLAKHFPNRTPFDCVHRDAEVLFIALVAKLVVLLRIDEGNQFGQRIRDDSKPHLSCAPKRLRTYALGLFTSQSGPCTAVRSAVRLVSSEISATAMTAPSSLLSALK